MGDPSTSERERVSKLEQFYCSSCQRETLGSPIKRDREHCNVNILFWSNISLVVSVSMCRLLCVLSPKHFYVEHSATIYVT